MAQLLDAAERNERLERQLHSAEQRLQLAKAYIALLQQKQTEPLVTPKESDRPTAKSRQSTQRERSPPTKVAKTVKESDTPSEPITQLINLSDT